MFGMYITPNTLKLKLTWIIKFLSIILKNVNSNELTQIEDAQWVHHSLNLNQMALQNNNSFQYPLWATYFRLRFSRSWMNQASQQWYDLDPRPRGITMSQGEWCTAPITMAVSHGDPPESRAGCNHDTISAAGHHRVMGCDRRTRGTVPPLRKRPNRTNYKVSVCWSVKYSAMKYNM